MHKRSREENEIRLELQIVESYIVAVCRQIMLRELIFVFREMLRKGGS